jgi:hypothetical protein
MSENGVNAFLLSSSLGLSGWVLADEMTIYPVSSKAVTA